jgi:MtfA peptidase
MPGDTLIITGNGDTVRVPDTLFQNRPASINHHGTLPGLASFWLGVGFVVLVTAVWLLALQRWKKHRYRKIHEEALAELNANYVQYDNWLSAYNSYYKSLSSALRRLFLERVAEFMETKKFDYIDITADEKMPLLISAASVQITFGLNKYLLDFFDTIHVLRNDYKYGSYNTPFAGHVNRNGIYLSWDNFLKGFEDDTDANNVGIHEMAHALAYVNFMADENDGEDGAFKKRFKEFSTVARPIFNDMQNGNHNLLGNYAATNYNEFWAVAVENFFEKSLQMKTEMPQLYVALSFLLNQDPLLPGKILHV